MQKVLVYFPKRNGGNDMVTFYTVALYSREKKKKQKDHFSECNIMASALTLLISIKHESG